MKELIDKFPNGQELYNTNAMFNKLVKHIYHGMSLYEAVSILAEQNEKQQEIMKNLINLMPIQPIMYSPDE